MSYSHVLYYETLHDVEKCKVLLPLFESKKSGKFKQLKKQVEDQIKVYYESLPEDVKSALGYLNFDTYIMRTFGFGITSLINPILNFLTTLKVQVKPEEAALLVLGVAFSLVRDTSVEQVRNFFLNQLKNKNFYEKVKKVLSVTKDLGIKALVKFLEYLAYASLAIPGASAVLNSLGGEHPNYVQTLGGVGLASVAQLARAVLTRAKKTTS